MAWSRTLAQLNADARARADMELVTGDDPDLDFVTNDTITNWINLAITELREFVIAEADELWDAGITVSANASTSQGVDRYALAADMFKPVGVDISYDGGNNWVTCHRFPFAERNNLRSFFGNIPRYAFVGGYIMFRPVPQGAITYRYWYVPTFTPLAADSDAYNFVNGWDDWVATRVAIRMLIKNKEDASELMADLVAIRQRILDACKVRDQGGPTRVADVRGMLPRPFDDEDAW